jgi:hypothetical protein
MFLLVLSYYVALYSLIFEIAEVVFAGHKANPGTSPTGTLVYRYRYHGRPHLLWARNYLDLTVHIQSVPMSNINRAKCLCIIYR